MSVYIYNPRGASETLPENRPASDKTQNRSSNNFVPTLSPLTSVLCEAPCVKCLIDVLPVRFLNLIEQRSDGCWQWLGSVRTTKYKRSRYRYGSYCNKLVHRMIYQAVYGKVPKGLEIDHLCQNTLCVNPEHLQAVTHQVNCARRFKSGPDPIPGSLNQRRKRARLVATSLLLVALLTPASPQRAHMFGLAGKADYRQSWICLSFANRGIADPFVSASYQMYGLHPSKVWESIVAERKARLGDEYFSWYTSDDILRPDVPRLPPRKALADGADLPTGKVGGSVSNPKEKAI